MNYLFTFALLIRMAEVIGLIGCFALAHFEKGIRLRRATGAFIFYFLVSLIAQIMQVAEMVEPALWWVGGPGTLALGILVFALVLDLREHYRHDGNGKNQHK